MADRRWFGRQSYSVLVLVVLLMTATGLTLVHWHKEWSAKGCELCHVRDLPLVQVPITDVPGIPVVTERDWQPEQSTYQPEQFSVNTSSRAPPQAFFFTA